MRDGSSPRITSIAVRHYASNQDRAFSIHQVAERSGILLGDIESHYNELEKQMLEDFFQYASTQPNDTKWLHWNMRDSTYGFAALEHRLQVLGGKPFSIRDSDKVDLPFVLKDIYGSEVAHHPRLATLVDLNALSKRGLLSGDQEPVAFAQHEYVKLDRSTLKQVDLIAEIAEGAAAGSLKTESTWRQQYGVSAGGLRDALSDNPTWMILSLLGVPLGLFGTALTIWQMFLAPSP